MPPRKLTLHEVRTHVHRHNQLQGGARMIEVWAGQISRAPSASPEARELAAQILTLCHSLVPALKTRVDPL